MDRRRAAAAAFEETLAELGLDEDDPELVEATKLGRRGALLAVAGTVWRRHLGPLLSTRQVIELLGVGSRQAVHDRVKRGRLLALPSVEGDLAYPAFQFTDNGEPYRAVGRVLETFAPAMLSPHTVASWFLTPQAALDGRTPVEWMVAAGDDERLAAAARRAVARAAR